MTILQRTTILRHRKENLKKCSLRGLESRKDLTFLTYPCDPIHYQDQAILLDLEGEILSKKDQNRPLFLIDGTWKYATLMREQLPQKENWEKRCLPYQCQTAYPRKQTHCLFPERGLASVEALYLAYYLLGYPVEGLLDHYHWKTVFLSLNHHLLIH